MQRMKRRADFLDAAKGARVNAAPFVLQGRDRRDDNDARVGFTVAKKTGNAVERNRIRRRLRAAADRVLKPSARAGFDYVLIARRQALSAPFAAIEAELAQAVSRLHGKKPGQSPARPAKKPPGGGEFDG
jgi:ribonuclease P protein component